MSNTTPLTAWQYIVDQNDAPTTCKVTGKELLRQYTRSNCFAQQRFERVQASINNAKGNYRQVFRGRLLQLVKLRQYFG